MRFDPIEHEYTTEDGRKLISVTQLLSKHGLSPNYSGVSPKVLAAAAARGVAIHSEIEEYVKSGRMGFTREFGQFLQAVVNLDLENIQSEIMLPREETPDTLVAGTADIICDSIYGKTLIDIKTTSKVDKRAYSWQLSLYEYLYGEQFNALIVLHYHADKMNVVQLDRVPREQIERLIDCERRGVIYREDESNLPIIADNAFLSEIVEVQKELAAAEEVVKAAKEKADKLKEELYRAMEEKGIYSWTSIDNALTVTRIAETAVQKFDVERFTADNPLLAEKYLTVGKRKGYIKITLRDGGKKERKQYGCKKNRK